MRSFCYLLKHKIQLMKITSFLCVETDCCCRWWSHWWKEDLPVWKNVTVKPKSEVVIVISPEETKVIKRPKPEALIEIGLDTKVNKSELTSKSSSDEKRMIVPLHISISRTRSKIVCDI